MSFVDAFAVELYTGKISPDTVSTVFRKVRCLEDQSSSERDTPMNKLPFLLTMLMLACSAQAQSHASGDRLAQMDSNSDGSITKEEFLADRERIFSKRDRNADGYLDGEDHGKRAARRGGERMNEMRDRLDENGDGKISKDEFVNPEAPLFTRADKDSNGTLDTEEISAAKQQMQSRAQRRSR